jgi:hypothetical protein
LAGSVAHDVAEGYVSHEQAASIYGVVIDAGGSIDAAATSARRAELAGSAPPPPRRLEIDREHLRIAKSLAGYVTNQNS